MVLLEFTPSAPLRHLVRTYRVVRFHFSGKDPIPFKPYPPRPEICLSLYPLDRERVVYAESGKEVGNHRAVVIGQSSELTLRHVGRNFLLFQIVFCPGGFSRLTGIPALELTNQYVDAQGIFGNSLEYLNDQLAEASDPAAMVDLVERFLTKENRRGSPAQHPTDFLGTRLLRSDAPIPVLEQAKLACMSLRQYERVFSQRMGVSPVFYSKVVRFEQAFRMKNARPDLDWLTIALHTGFHDYQHLSKVYVQLTGQSPKSFHALDQTAPARVFAEADTY